MDIIRTMDSNETLSFGVYRERHISHNGKKI
jgi:hypothetical protein